MRNLHRSLSTARQSGGFTLVELLVVIGIIAILAGVALGPIASGLRQAKESAAMQTCRTIALAEFSYANDNSNYPGGADSGVIAKALLTGNYVSDPAIFRINGSKAVSPAAITGFTLANCTYDFMDYTFGTVIGLPATSPDTLPAVWSPDQGAAVPSGTTGKAITPSAGFFGKDGIAVGYKSNNAFFRSPQKSSDVAIFPGVGNCIFVDQGIDMTPPGTGAVWNIRTGSETY